MALKTLYQILLSCDRSRLRVIARQWDITLNASGKPDLAAELVDGMANEEAVSRCLERLTQEQREALDDLLRRGGMMPWAIFVRQWGEIRTVGAGRLEREELWHVPQSSAEALWFLGLAQRAFTEDADHPVEMAFVPEELMLYIPPAPAVAIPAPLAAAAPLHVTPGTGTLADDLVNFWAAQQQGSISGSMSPSSKRRALVEILSLERGWLRARDHSLNAEAVLDWLRSDSWSQASSLFDAWRSSQEWKDIAHVSSLQPDPIRGWPTPALESRSAFLEILSHCQPGSWYTIEAFTEYVRTYAMDFLRPDGDYDTWAPRSARSGTPLRGVEAWQKVEGEFITALLTGCLHWLGAVSLGGQTSQAQSGFTLTEMGAAWLGMSPPPKLPAPPPLTIEADGQIVIPARRRYERFQLGRVADLVSAPEFSDNMPPGSDKATYHYRFSAPSLSRARQQRIPPDRIVAFLEEALEGRTLPDHLKTLIQQGYPQKGSANLSRAWLLSVTEPEHLRLPGVAELIRARISADCVVIDDRYRERLVAVLGEQGIAVNIVQDE